MTKREMLYATNFLRREPIEHFFVFCLKDGELFGQKEFGKGDENEIYLNINEIIKYIVSTGCTDFFISHNHPDQTSLPSTYDVDFTRSIFKKAYAKGLNMIDHLIMSKRDSFSFKETNFLDSLAVLETA